MNCTIHVAKTKALISFAVTAKLICAFVFAYAKCWFSHDMAHLYLGKTHIILNVSIKGQRQVLHLTRELRREKTGL